MSEKKTNTWIECPECAVIVYGISGLRRHKCKPPCPECNKPISKRVMGAHVAAHSRPWNDLSLKILSPMEKQLMILLEGGPKTRDQLVKQTGIPRTTIYDGLKKLMARERVTRYPLYIDDRKRGRPRVVFQLNEETGEDIGKERAKTTGN